MGLRDRIRRGAMAVRTGLRSAVRNRSARAGLASARRSLRGGRGG